jgi:hypothetical protein
MLLRPVQELQRSQFLRDVLPNLMSLAEAGEQFLQSRREGVWGRAVAGCRCPCGQFTELA